MYDTVLLFVNLSLELEQTHNGKFRIFILSVGFFGDREPKAKMV